MNRNEHSLLVTSLTLGDHKVYRNITFDLDGFDLLQDIKRFLEAHHKTRLTNSQVVRCLLMSHVEALEIQERTSKVMEGL